MMKERQNETHILLIFYDNIHKLHDTIGRKIFKQINNFVFSHKDLSLKHILMLKNETLALIDWERALYLDFCYDYAVFFTSILMDAGDEKLLGIMEKTFP